MCVIMLVNNAHQNNGVACMGIAPIDRYQHEQAIILDLCVTKSNPGHLDNFAKNKLTHCFTLLLDPIQYISPSLLFSSHCF